MQAGFGLALQPVDKPAAPTYHSSIIATEPIQRQINRLLDEAKAAFSQHDWVDLQERAQDLLAFVPDHEPAIPSTASKGKAWPQHVVWEPVRAR